MSLVSMYINYQFKKSDDKRDLNHNTPDNIIRHDDISYGPHGKWNLLDVYYPKNVEGKLPVIVNIHGGGWVYGTKETYQYYMMSMAGRGFVGINFNYRLAPKSKFPAQIEDINSVLHWIIENKDNYPIDENNIFIVGDSAGAHLASLYTSLCTDEEYQKQFDFKPPKGFVPNAVAYNCGIYDLNDFNDDKMTKAILKDLLGRKDFKTKLESVKPLKYLNKNFPPAFIMSATGDFLLEQSSIFKEKMDELGIVNEIKIYGDETNKPAHVFHANISDEIATLCNDDECEFMRKYLK